MILILTSLFPILLLILLPSTHSNDKLQESALLSKENERFQEALVKASSLSVDITGFYHTSAWQPHWKEVITEQLLLLDGRNKTGASLLNATSTLHIVIADQNPQNYSIIKTHMESLPLHYANKIQYMFNQTIGRMAFKSASKEERKVLRHRVVEEHISAGEYASIMSLHQHCKAQVKAGKRAYVYYFHAKGACCSKTPPGNAVSDWRDEMNAFNLEFPSICLRAMNQGYATCGVNYQFHHYSGNFFWANCAHINKLPPLWDPLNNAWDAEFYVLRVKNFADMKKFPEDCGFHPFHCNVWHYHDRCPRSKYIRVIENLLMKEELKGGYVPPLNCTS